MKKTCGVSVSSDKHDLKDVTMANENQGHDKKCNVYFSCRIGQSQTLAYHFFLPPLEMLCFS